MRVRLLPGLFIIILLGLAVAQPNPGRARVDNGKTKADIERKGGKLSVGPSAKDDEGVDMEIEEVTEVDVNGTEVGNGRQRSHSFKNFKDLTFNVSGPNNKDFGGLEWKAIELTALLPNGTAVIKIEILNALESGEIEIQGELQAISEGFVKFNVIINDWKFCEGTEDNDNCGDKPGQALLMKLRMKGKGKARGKRLMQKADHESMRGVTKQKERPQKSKGMPGKDKDRPSPSRPSDGMKPTVSIDRPKPTAPTGEMRPTRQADGPRPTPPAGGPGDSVEEDDDDSERPIRVREKLGGKRWSHIVPDDLRGKENKTLPDVYGFGASDDDDDSYIAFSRVMTIDGEGRQMDPDFPSIVTDDDGSVVSIKFDKFNRTIIYDPTFIVEGASDITSTDGRTTSSAALPVFSTIVLALILTARALL